MTEFIPQVPPQHTSGEILEAAAGLVGVALFRGHSDPQALYDDLGALLTLIMGARADLVTVRGVKPR